MNLNADDLRAKDQARRMREDIGCSDCNYLGYVLTSNGSGALCKCMKKKTYHKLFDEAAIPRIWWEKTLDDWDTRQDSKGYDLGSQQNVSKKIKRLFAFYAKNLKNIAAGFPPSITHSSGIKDKLHSLVLEGGNGSGKTFLIAVMLQDALKMGLTAHFIEWSDLIDACRSFQKEDELNHLRDVFEKYDLVAIDNTVPYDNLPNHCFVQLDRFFRARLNSGKPTLIGAEPGWENTNAGSGWRALTSNCLVVHLPRTDQRTNSRM